MNEPTKGARLGAGMVALLAVVCCAGLPLLLAAGLSTGLAVALGGAVLGAIVALAGAALLAIYLRRRRAARCRMPSRQIGEQL